MMSDEIVVGFTNGRAIIRFLGVFGPGFNVYVPPEDSPPSEIVYFAKENSRTGFFATQAAAEAWAAKRPPMQGRQAQLAAETEEAWRKLARRKT